MQVCNCGIIGIFQDVMVALFYLSIINILVQKVGIVSDVSLQSLRS